MMALIYAQGMQQVRKEMRTGGTLRMWMRALMAEWLLTCIVLATANAASTARSYTMRAWTSADGLPLGAIQALAQGPDRYLWIGTDGGLIRFDGSTFQSIHALPQKSIFALLASRDGALWVGTEGAGLYRIFNGSVQSFGIKQGLTNAFIRAIVQDQAGSIWIGTDEGLYRSQGDRFERIDNTPQFSPMTVHAILLAHDGSVWVGGSRLVRWNHGSVEEWQWSGKTAQTAIKSMLERADGTLELGCANGLYRLTAKDRATHRAARKVAGLDDTVRALHLARSGTLWMATSRHGVLQSEAGMHSVPLPLGKSTVGNTALSICEDSDGNLWIGSQSGLIRLHNTQIATIALPAAHSSDYGSLFEDRDGSMWFAYSGLYRYAGGALKAIKLPGLDASLVHTIYRDRTGVLWLGSNGQGIFRIAQGVTHHYTIADGLVNNFIRAVVQSADGTVWIATDGGLSRWAADARGTLRMSNVLVNTTARDLLATPDNDLWVATRTGIVHLHGSQQLHDALTERLREEIVSSLCQDASGGLWIGTESDGIFREKDVRVDHFTRQQGLPTDRILKVLADKNGALWMSSTNGVAAIPIASFDAVARGERRSLTVNELSVEEELQSAQIYGSYPSSALLAHDGHVWFAGIDGPIRIPQAMQIAEASAPVSINAVIANGRSVNSNGIIRMAPDTSRVELHYAAILPQSPERIRYRYRLEGFDPGWTEATTAKMADYTNLPAGHYVFHVMAYDMNDPQRMSEASIEFVQLPHFYRTPWFLSLCALVLVVVAISGHGIYTHQVRAKYRGILQERARVARELHDTLIQGCTTVSALLDASALTEGEASQNLISHARNQIRITTEMARRVVWNLRNDTKANEGFEQTAASIVNSFRKDFNLPVHCAVSGRSIELSEEVQHELRMVMREALYNSARHAHATDVRVEIVYDNDTLEMILSDDGVGFNVAHVTGNHSDHYGLRGIQERIARLGGSVRIESSKGKGTRIAISLPDVSLAGQQEREGAAMAG